jgi:hypothetical protein
VARGLEGLKPPAGPGQSPDGGLMGAKPPNGKQF